ncbi:hypothetical protein K4L44_03665 [Halosquirtibacter laminarini]|uniref:Uncharacterized protein n=1 Tax=Halosquirtibacter laminarini TaxID=3374600 RepID=A0AC61NHE4_9BACT|nr:hypothetical protein K4L44_03665 [Prolixibacteraceae bacterium]
MELDKLKNNKKSWDVPDGYFDQFSAKMMERIDQEESVEAPKVKPSKVLMWSYVGVAASILLMVVNLFVMSSNRQMQDKIDTYLSAEMESTPQIEVISEEEMEDIQEYLVDNKLIYDAIYNEENTEK